MKELNFSTGVVEMSVNGGRTIRFNPADVGFLDTIFSLWAKLDSIKTDEDKKREKTDDPAKFFDYTRICDKRMKAAVDSVFGDGFSEDVFQELRLFAMADGLTVIENFFFAIIDEMDENIRDNMAKRDARIAKYVNKYQKYKK